MPTYKMMEEIVCHCSKCKLDLNHRIIRVEAGQPKRVLCLTCRTERAYRRIPTERSSEGALKKPRTLSAKAAQEAEWLARLDRLDRVPKPYGMDQSFLLDDYVEHRVFGMGLVVHVVAPDKIDVFFRDGLKTLKCGTKSA